MRRALLPLAGLLATSAASAQAPASMPSAIPAPPTAMVAPVDLVRVTLDTAKGRIVLALNRQQAPATVRNFLRYVDAKRFDGTNFYRAMRLGEGTGLIQFGASRDPRRRFPPVRHEPTTDTGLSNVDGAVSMAMGAPGTATADVFIVVGDLHTLDATASDPGFAVFGQVVEGMDVVRAILAAPTSPTEGEGAMKGQMLAPTIKVVSARRD